MTIGQIPELMEKVSEFPERKRDSVLSALEGPLRENIFSNYNLRILDREVVHEVANHYSGRTLGVIVRDIVNGTRWSEIVALNIATVFLWPNVEQVVKSYDFSPGERLINTITKILIEHPQFETAYLDTLLCTIGNDEVRQVIYSYKGTARNYVTAAIMGVAYRSGALGPADVKDVINTAKTLDQPIIHYLAEKYSGVSQEKIMLAITEKAFRTRKVDLVRRVAETLNQDIVAKVIAEYKGRKTIGLVMESIARTAHQTESCDAVARVAEYSIYSRDCSKELRVTLEGLNKILKYEHIPLCRVVDKTIGLASNYKGHFRSLGYAMDCAVKSADVANGSVKLKENADVAIAPLSQENVRDILDQCKPEVCSYFVEYMPAIGRWTEFSDDVTSQYAEVARKYAKNPEAFKTASSYIFEMAFHTGTIPPVKGAINVARECDVEHLKIVYAHFHVVAEEMSQLPNYRIDPKVPESFNETALKYKNEPLESFTDKMGNVLKAAGRSISEMIMK